MKDDGRILPAIEEMTDEDFEIAKARMIAFLDPLPQITAKQFNEVFTLISGYGGGLKRNVVVRR